MSLTKCCGQPKSVLTVERVLEAREIGEFSLAGVQPKFSAEMKAMVQCTHCGWTARGHVEDGVIANGAFISGTFVVD
jgi:hypothetical protein